jgi:hypothetical protein
MRSPDPKLLRAAYLRLNRKWFRSQLPQNLKVKWFRSSENDMGDYGEGIIRVNSRISDWRCTWELVLLHEMCHAMVDQRGGERNPHGRMWRAERRRLYVAGAFEMYI